MKSFTDIFIRRPILAVVLNLLILIGGIQALRTLIVRQYPRSDNSEITVTTVYVGASADLVRGFVTTPLERAIAAADGIDYIQSASALSLSTITVRLKINYDPIKALAEISSKVDQVRNNLPPEAEVPIINVESADSQMPAGFLTVTSDMLDPNQITDYIVRVVQPRLSALEGVQRADMFGGRTFAMRIWLKPDRLAAFNINPAQIRDVLAANNFLAALGQTKGSLIQVNLSANTDLRSVEDFRNLVVRQSGDNLVRLRDVADVVLGAEDYETEARFSGQTSVFMGVWPLPNANTLDVMRRVRAEMAAIQQEMPTGMKGAVAYDASAYIQDAIHEVVKTLSETLLIVSIVIFLFLGSVRSVLVPLVAIPISLIGAVFLMQIFGFSLNLLTLLAVVLSVGLVVDDAIVVVENVERHVREGQTPVRAAVLGARELISPIIAMTITLAAVYAPIGLQGGLTGALFREFAFTLAGAVFISGVVALTLSPVMSSKLLIAGQEERGLVGRINHGFDALRRVYARVLDTLLAARPAVYLVWLGLSLLTIPAFYMAWQAKELAPAEDQGFIMAMLEAPADASIDQKAFYGDAVSREFMNVSEADQTFQITSPAFNMGGLVLKPWKERTNTVFALVPQITQRLGRIPGIQARAMTPAAQPGGTLYPQEFVIASTDEPEVILKFAQQLQEKAATNGLFRFLTVDTWIDQPQYEVVLDRDKVASLGLNMATVGSDLSTMVGGNFVNWFNLGGRSYKVIPQVKRVERLNASQLENDYVKGPNGQLVPLSTFATLQKKTGPRSLNKFQQFNAVKLQGVAAGSLEASLRFLEDECAKTLPKGYKVDYTGEARQLRVEGNKFLPAFTLAVLLIFLVLAAQFNSFRDPLIIILGSVPLAIFGAVIFSFLKMPGPIPFFTDGWTTSLNIYAQVGLVTLVGLVSKNGILIVQFANELQRAGMPKLKAVREAALIRLRPVLMTSAATVCGHFPLTLVTGAGAAARNSIGITIVAGMALGTIFTLLVIPAIYVLIAKQHAGEEVGVLGQDLREESLEGMGALPAATEAR
jgi:multidrug efflux pump